MQLVVAEKPSVARDLARALGVAARGATAFEGDRWVITWCVGHLVELEEPAAYDARWKAWRLDSLPIAPAELRLRAAVHSRAQLAAVLRLLRDRRFTAVINACDAGREGELIFRNLLRYAKVAPRVRRLWISSLTDEAIRKGLAALRPGEELDALGDAARCRAEADWLVGMNATRAVTARAREAGGSTLYSIGRVQTPTLAMLVEREREIERFVPQAYWEVRGEMTLADGASFIARWRHVAGARLASAALADAVVARASQHGEPDGADGAEGADGADGPRVEHLVARTVKEPPPLLFDLTALQRTANRRFGFSAARTLELAQSLYERDKLLTYPRTDSRHLSTELTHELPTLWRALAEVADYQPFAAQLEARPPRQSRRVVDDSKVRDHHAIIPTANVSAAAVQRLGRDERRLFDLVARRFLGAFFPDAEIAVTEVWIAVGPGGAEARRALVERVVAAQARRGGEPAPPVAELPAAPDVLFARGRTRLLAGWQAVMGLDEGAARARRGDESGNDGDGESAAALPPLARGQLLRGRFGSDAKQTTPPPRYTEASLLGAMESAGKSIDDEALREAMKERGLGTPATRAAIVETLLRRGYVERRAGHLVATATGQALVAALPVPSLCSPELTGEWEARLARVARGSERRAVFMADIARYVSELVAAVREAPPPAATERSPAEGAPWRGKPRRASRSRTRAGGKPGAPRRAPRSVAAEGGARSSGRGGRPSARAGRGGRSSARAGASAAARASATVVASGAVSAMAMAAAAPSAATPGRRRRRRAAAVAEAVSARPSRGGGATRGAARASAEAASPASLASLAGHEPLEPSLAAAQAAVERAIEALPSRRTGARAEPPRGPAPAGGALGPKEPVAARPRSDGRAAAGALASVRSPRASAAVAAELGCPRCGLGHLVTGQRGWGCSRWREGCGFVVWFETAGRRLTSAQLADLIRRGKTRKAVFRDPFGAEVPGRLVLEPALDGGAARLVAAP